MERRGVLGLIAGCSLPVGLGGCLTGTSPADGGPSAEEGEPESDPESDDEDETETPAYDCPRLGHLEVYVVSHVPDEKTVLDAEKDGLTDSRYLSDALAAASDEYEPGTVDEIDPDERLHSDRRLAKIDSEELASSGEVTETLEYGEPTYVQYEGATYLLLYVESVC